MKHLLLYFCAFFACWTALAQDSPPYSGTIFVDGAILTSSDATLFSNITAAGRGIRTVYDRRTSSWNSINAFLFKIEWSDGLTSEAQVNPEFDEESARFEAEKYGIIVGRLPNCLRKNVRSIWIHKGKNPFGGGNNALLIHTDQSAEYEKTGILEETLVHEATHTSLDGLFASATDWLKAQTDDGNSISTYAKENPTREDVAETFLMWIAARQKPSRISQKNLDLIRKTIPNRLLFFDNQALNLLPLTLKTTEIDKTVSKPITSIYPNPFSNYFVINSPQDHDLYKIEVYSLTGNLVHKMIIDHPVTVLNSSRFVSGFYVAKFSDRSGVTYTQVIKRK